MRSTWMRPDAGGMTASTPVSMTTAPTRLPPRVSTCARVVATSASTRSFWRSTGPKPIDAEWSSSSHAVRSRSSTYSRTYGSSSRAVTFHSMWRRSSPGTYSRRSVKSSPDPRKRLR